MNARERIEAILNRNVCDRPALIAPVSNATAESCRQLGLSFQDVHLDGEKAAALAAYPHEQLGFDSMMPYFSIVLEGAALGAEIDWGGPYTMPSIRKPLFSDPDEFVLPADFLDRPPITALLDTIRLLRQRYGDTALILGKVLGPWTLALHLYGMEPFLIDTVLQPAKARTFMEQFAGITRLFAEAQLTAGADMITLADHITADLASPDTYLNLLQPLHRQIIQTFPANTFILHCCGNTTDRVAYFADAGFPVFHFDSKNKLDDIIRKTGSMQLTGAVNNPETLLFGTVEDVFQQTRSLMAAGIRLISPECAIPLQVKNVNLQAIARAVGSLD